MALALTGTGQYADHPFITNYRTGNRVTMMMWHYPTTGPTTTPRQTFAHIIGGGQFNTAYWRTDSDGHMWWQQYAGVTTRTLYTNFTHFALNKWVFHVWSSNANTNVPYHAVGDLSNLAAEPSSYTTQTAATGFDSWNLLDTAYRIQNDHNDTARTSLGRIAFFAIHAKWMPLIEARTHQFRPRMLPETRLFARYGYGAVNGIDYSGLANSATIIGSPTVADGGVPLRPIWGAASGWRGTVGGSGGPGPGPRRRIMVVS